MSAYGECKAIYNQIVGDDQYDRHVRRLYEEDGDRLPVEVCYITSDGLFYDILWPFVVAYNKGLADATDVACGQVKYGTEMVEMMVAIGEKKIEAR